MEELTSLLADLVDEVRGLRSDISDFRQLVHTTYLDTVTSIDALPENIGDRVTGSIGGVGGVTLEDLADRIMGGFSGVGGASLEDISTKLDAIDGTLNLIDVNTSA